MPGVKSRTVLIKSKYTGKPYVPHKYQSEVHNSSARFRIVIAGRRWGKTLCVTPDTVISGPYREIDQLVDWVLNSEGTFEPVKVIMKREYKGRIFTIKARYLLPLKVTEEHPLLIAKLKRKHSGSKELGWHLEWKKWLTPKEIPKEKQRRVKYCLVMPLPKEVRLPFLLPLSKDLAYFYGLYVAEGSTWRDGITLSLGPTEHYLAERVRAIMSKYKKRAKVYKSGRSIAVHIYSRKWRDLFKKVFGENAARKRIPPAILYGPRELLESFLEGYFDGDGCYTRTGRVCTTISKVLALQIQLAEFRLGRQAGVYLGNRREHSIRGRSIRGRPLYTVFVKYAGHQYSIRQGQEIYLPILQVDESLYSGEVYNLETPSRTYVANNVVVHNCALMDLLRFMIEHPNAICFWVVPLYKHLIPVSEAVREWVPDILIKHEYTLQKTYRYLELHNGSKVWFHSAEQPDSLRGAGLDYVVLEEAAQLKEEVWYSIILPELLDRKGKALIISTPKGKNWLYQEYLKAKSGKYPEYAVWQRPSSDRLPIEELEAYRRKYPEDIFRQEFLAEFIEEGGEVFRNVRRCFKGAIDEERFKVLRYSDGMRMVPREPIENKMVYVGVDIGRHEDFTVFVALDEDGELVGFERFTRMSFPLQKERLAAFLSHFPRRQILFDSRGIGAGFYEELRSKGIRMRGIQLTNPTKNSMIHNLVIKLDEGEIRGPYIPELVEELEAFSFKISRAGNVIYEAPENMNDDCVMALAFAASMLRKKATDWISLKGKGYLSIRGG